MLNTTQITANLSNTLSTAKMGVVPVLHGLVESLDFADVHSEVLAYDGQKVSLAQQLKIAISNYQASPADPFRKKELLRGLKHYKSVLQKEHQYARKQRRIYESQAIQKNPAYYSLQGLGQWILNGVKDFFGSSPAALVEKYTKIANDRGEKINQIEQYIDTLRQIQKHKNTEPKINNIQHGAQGKVGLSPSQNFPQQSLSTSMPRISLPVSSKAYFSNPSNAFLTLSMTQISGQPAPPWIDFIFSAPKLIGSYPNKIARGYDVALSGNIAFFADDTYGFQILDVTNLGQPTLLYSGLQGSAITSVVVFSDNTLIVSDYNGAIYIFDVSNLRQPNVLGTFHSTAVERMAVYGNTLFLVGNSGIQLIDVSNLRQPTLLATYPNIGGGSMWDVKVSGNTAFVANLGDRVHSLLIIDVSNVRQPTLIGSVPFPNTGTAYSLAVSGNTVFVADNTALRIIDVTSLTQPTVLATYPTPNPGNAWGIASSGNKVFIADFNGGLLIIDVSNLNRPTLLASYSKTGMEYFSVTVSGNTAFVADWGAGLQIIDASTWQLTATMPGIEYAGNYQMQLVATDSFGNTATNPFTFRVEGPPIVHGSIPAQNATVNQAFNYGIPAGIFTDPNHDTLTYTTSNVLPSWLSFNGMAATFSGTPQEQDIGESNLVVYATDTITGTVSTHFKLTVISAGVCPKLNQQISNQQTTVGQSFLFQVPVGTFTCPSGAALFYNASLVDGTGLPSWLTFNSAVQTFIGIPGRGDTDPFSSKTLYVAVNAYRTPVVNNGYVTATFNINVAGMSYYALALSIGGPIFTAITTAYALYKERSLISNRCNKKGYQQPEQQVMPGDNFDYELKTPLAKVKTVEIRVPNRKKDCFSSFDCLRDRTEKIKGGALLPYWMEYNHDTNHLTSSEAVPDAVEKELIVRVTGNDDGITEEFNLRIGAEFEVSGSDKIDEAAENKDGSSSCCPVLFSFSPKQRVVLGDVLADSGSDNDAEKPYRKLSGQRT